MEGQIIRINGTATVPSFFLKKTKRKSVDIRALTNYVVIGLFMLVSNTLLYC